MGFSWNGGEGMAMAMDMDSLEIGGWLSDWLVGWLVSWLE
jgi:hypothetical protein